MQLVLDGALDATTETTLAARLGLSPRHLRRLFTEHVGVTPDGLARSARTHFARRLLDDTDLSLADIAFAAGFGSVRQFNRSCRAVFRMAPQELRARRRRADRLAADGGLLLRLPFTGSLDWPAQLTLLAGRVTPGVEQVNAGAYRRTITVEGHPGVLELTAGGADHLLLRLHLPRWQELLHLVGRARRLASLDLDLDAAIRRLAGDPTLGPLLTARPGLRPPGSWDPFEAGIGAILADGAPVAAGRRAAAAIVERFGVPVPGLTQLGLTHTFPPAELLATAPLHTLALPPRQAEALRMFAGAVAAGALRLDGSVPLEGLLRALTTVGGLSDRAAADLALRLGEPDADPRPAGHRGPPDEADGHGWSPWRAVAVTHLQYASSRTQRAAPPAGPAAAGEPNTRRRDELAAF